MNTDEFNKILEELVVDFIDDTKETIEQIKQLKKRKIKQTFPIYFEKENYFGDYFWYQKEIENIVNSNINKYFIKLLFSYENNFIFNPLEENFYLNFAGKDDTAYILYIMHDSVCDLNNIPKCIKHIYAVSWSENIVDGNYLLERNRLLNRKGIDINLITLKQFFVEYIGNEDLYRLYVSKTSGAIDEVYRNVNMKSIPMLTNRYMFDFKDKLKSLLLSKSNEIKKYTVVNIKHINENRNYDNGRVNLENYSKRLYNLDILNSKYIDENRYLSLIGTNDYAKSFITSEYLYEQFNKDNLFDYTSIVSGYLKSIEQLLYMIIKKFVIRENCRYFIDSKGIRDIKDKDKKHVCYEYYDYKLKQYISIPDADCSYSEKNRLLILLNSKYEPLFDTSLGSLCYFIYNNKENVTNNDNYKKYLFECLNCYRDECRNEYMHKIVIDTWDYVEIIRNNTYFLYKCILGMFEFENCNQNEVLGIADTTYDDICRTILDKHIYRFIIIKDSIFYHCKCLNEKRDLICDKNGFVSLDKLKFGVYDNNDEFNIKKTIVIDRENIPDEIQIQVSVDENNKPIYYPIFKNNRIYDMMDYYRNKQSNIN